MLAVLLLVILAGSMFLASPRPSGRAEARDAAMRMRAMLTAALTEAETNGGDVIVRAEATPGSARNGRFLALAGPPGITAGDDPDADWVDLEGGVAWRAGTATIDPMGAPTDGRVPGTVRCTAAACETGSADYVVYPVGHLRSAGVSWALMITRERGVQLFRWDQQAGGWEAAR